MAESDRDRNRREMPETAALLDGLRAAGIQPAWFRVTENGRTVQWGRRTEDRDAPPVPGVCRQYEREPGADDEVRA